MEKPPNPAAGKDPAAPTTSAAAAAAEEHGPWEWGHLLDFSIEEDDSLLLSWDDTLPPSSSDQLASPPTTLADEATTSGEPSRVRKRDPRLVCDNYLASRIPCSCPEVDEKDEDEEEGGGGGEAAAGGGRKRMRTGGVAAEVRCQVPECGADIRELKGYHRRHRVCLLCANAPSVVLEGEAKRYCQQCGKFHVLTDFDEGKRSCRRKLERHNRRRRGRFADHKCATEFQENLLVEDTTNAEEQTEEPFSGAACESDSLDATNKITDIEALESVGHGSPFRSDRSARIGQSSSGTSFAAPGETQAEEKVDNPRPAISLFSENKCTYSSVCPTGRVSFKLYDWNPAEFPRELRNQIFQWLASMPVELEGYIRPGCTILTIFIAMPHFMWHKLSEDATHHVHNLVKTPGSLFYKKGEMDIYLNNKVFKVLKDGSLFVNVKIDVQVPKLHYVHPNLFESGKPVEFVACGSNLFQPKFRFLVSFAGKYLKYESCDAIFNEKMRPFNDGLGVISQGSQHEMFRIKIPHTELHLFGPAFIEVENESGLSNFIPVLFAEKDVCSELLTMHQPFIMADDRTLSEITDGLVIPSLYTDFISKQSSMSEVLLDVAWLSRKPWFDEHKAFLSSTNIQRLNCLLRYLIQNKFVNILNKVLQYLEPLINGKKFNNVANRNYNADEGLFEKYVDEARIIILQKHQHGREKEPEYGNLSYEEAPLQQSNDNNPSRTDKDNEVGNNDMNLSDKITDFGDNEVDESILTKNLIHRQGNFQHEQAPLPLKTITNPRLAIYIMTCFFICFGFCVTILHPHKAGELLGFVRRCMFDAPNRR